MLGKISRGLIWHLRIFIFWAHIIGFSWKLADEKRSRGENQKKIAKFQTPNSLDYQM